MRKEADAAAQIRTAVAFPLFRVVRVFPVRGKHFAVRPAPRRLYRLPDSRDL